MFGRMNIFVWRYSDFGLFIFYTFIMKYVILFTKVSAPKTVTKPL